MLAAVRFVLSLVVLLLVTAACGGGDPASLPGTSWTLTSLDGNDPVAGTAITAEFGEDGAVFGSGGCNTYNGGYTVDGDSIQMGPFASTKMACEEPVSAQEFAFFAAMEGATGYTIDGDTLEIVSPEGTLTFASA